MYDNVSGADLIILIWLQCYKRELSHGFVKFIIKPLPSRLLEILLKTPLRFILLNVP
jgi:hypothetical protein